MAHGQEPLDLALIHRPMLHIEPDRVIAIMGGVTHKKWQIVPQAANADAAARANFLQDFTVPHIPPFFTKTQYP
jgi:hypothetical protein